MVPRIVGLSGVARSGKTTVSTYLHELYGYENIKFAKGLKDMLRAMGLSEEQIEGSQKEIPCDMLCGKTPRQLQQWIGTEFGRNLVGENLWCNIWKNNVERYLTVDRYALRVVVDDVRFPNEVDAVKDMGGLVIRIERPGITKINNHPSETSLDDMTWEHKIINDGNIADLYNKVHKILILNSDVDYNLKSSQL